ncbi:ATP-binding cassette domain-containing protein [Chloroflexota bacterium]|nr:ATP-binding cassette domain-containing protein [Chloroflexota bacterium]
MDSLLEVSNLKKYFKTPRGMLHAVDDVSFVVNQGETLGVVGESGCGKSTLGRVIIRLIDSTAGKVIFDGEDITNSNARQTHALRQKMQIIFQDPYSSLNPRLTVGESISEPLVIHKLCAKKAEIEKQVYTLMDTVGLARRYVNSYPHELDGGRRQRIGIARALALNPKFIVCDEPISALDVSIQAQILNLMQDLQEEKDFTYIFITHNLSVIKHISKNIMVMYLGVTVEKCSTDALFDKQLHPYTKALLAAIPEPKIHKTRVRKLLTGEITSPIEPKPGCRFAARCEYAKEKCFNSTPKFEEVLPDHFVACHWVREINGL